ncbi:MAG: hypothetical protein LBL56_01180 [Treponema sp.]|jgi:hypothetical protein|nr:hypothetical protein [Treponema sp.]
MRPFKMFLTAGTKPPALIPALMFLVLLPFNSGAQNSQNGFPSLIPDSRALEFARGGDDYSWEDLAEMALWASAQGIPAPANQRTPRVSPASRSYTGILRGAVEELRTELTGMDPRSRGDYILAYMHRTLLRSYSAFQTRLDTLLSNGTYNCVSSAVLYLILAQSQGLGVRGVVTRDHAFVTVVQGEDSWDVETTNPYGFDPGNRREFQDQFGKVTGFTYVPARNYRDRTDLSPLELVSLILHNHIADTEQRRRYDVSVSIALNRASLLAGRRNPAISAFFTDPQKDLRDRILNYGASLLNAGKEEEGLRWAVYADSCFTGAGGEDDPRWQNYINLLASNHTVKLCRAGRFTEAQGFLADTRSLLDPAEYRRLEIMVVETELAALANGIKQAADAVNVMARLEEAETAGLVSESRARELRDHVSLWRATDFHNRFAGAFNRRDYSGARGILDEALTEFPTNRRLLGDRSTLERALAPR